MGPRQERARRTERTTPRHQTTAPKKHHHYSRKKKASAQKAAPTPEASLPRSRGGCPRRRFVGTPPGVAHPAKPAANTQTHKVLMDLPPLAASSPIQKRRQHRRRQQA